MLYKLFIVIREVIYKGQRYNLQMLEKKLIEVRKVIYSVQRNNCIRSFQCKNPIGSNFVEEKYGPIRSEVYEDLELDIVGFIGTKIRSDRVYSRVSKNG